MHFSFFSTLILALLSVSVKCQKFVNFPQNNGQSLSSYDFIIVGGGTAGCVLANRISEKYTVLLLEAGGEPPAFTDIPGIGWENLANPNFTFQYEAVKQPNAALGNNGGAPPIPRGRVLGGSSQVNLMMYNRGSPLDYDQISNFTGDTSWRYENMLKYFKRVETYLGEFPDPEQHGFDGSIPISSVQGYPPGIKEWLDAGRELGFSVGDPNGPQKIGFSPTEFSKKHGRRVSSYTGYLKPIMGKRRNLRVITNAYVTRLIFKGNSAIGVRYNDDGSSFYESPNAQLAYAKREIILSAGVFGTSSLLMRSGVGPKDVLRQARVPLVRDLPVGKNSFQDHPLVPIPIVVNNKLYSINPTTDYNPETFQLYQRFGRGPYSTAGVGDGGQAFLSSSFAKAEGHSEWSDIWLVMIQRTQLFEPFRNFSMAPWETNLYVDVILGRPKSRGSVKLNPKNIDDMPIIEANYLEDERDVQTFLEGIYELLQIIETTESFKRLGARIPYDPVSACSHLKFKSKPYWECFVRQTLMTGHHSSGTCAINSVVDSTLRVIGMNGLRVVDDSVLPFITNANLQAPVYAIAEKSADVILRYHR